MATISLRMDDDTKLAFDGFCESAGLTVSAALNMFVKRVVRDNKLPFEVTGDPFWNDANQARLKESIKEVESGHYTAHELIDVED